MYELHVRDRVGRKRRGIQRRGWTSHYGLCFESIMLRLPAIKTDAIVRLDGRDVGGVEKRRDDNGRPVWVWSMEEPRR